ncbi:MAG: hypothetical protein CBE50_002255 [Flammeovirgaceae bacterium TMED290]|nr:MAG: hypothetical protein CBE50_002255 [Flammeovirgaceae bacterium TMED290]|tara:strand:+ start:6378 stop:7004 length:627 start_codon:yes stop_codon:yes gene_type:complete
MNKVFFILLFPLNIIAQKFPSDMWHPGQLVTKDSDTIKGNLKYDFDNQSIQLDDGKTLKAYNVNNLYFFEIFDETINDYRQFYSLLYEISYNYEVPILFEMVIEGELSLLLREKIVAESVSNNYFPSYYSYSMIPSYQNNYSYINKIKYDYFFLSSNGKIYKFSGKKRELFQIMNKKSKEIKEYFNAQKINLKKMIDIVKVTNYYNKI